MEVRTILVPTDFSDHAQHALDYAVDLAQTLGARLHLLHAYHLDIPLVGPGAIGVPADFHDQLRSSAEARLQEIVQEVRARGVEVDGSVAPDPATLAIIDTAKRLPADLIVMSTHGRTGIAHVLLGSVAERTVRLAPCPVVTLRARE